MDRLECDRMLVAVLESGSFSRAAERLGISTAKASKLISRLESDLGVQLISRTTRALSATEIGQFYYERVRVLLNQIDELDNAVQHSSSNPSGRLRITAPLSFGVSQLVPVLNRFAEHYPDIQLDVSFSDKFVSLVDEGFDAAVRIGIPADSRLMARRLCSASVVTVASPAYLEQYGEPTTPQQLGEHECIIDTNVAEPCSWRFSCGQSDLSVTVNGRIRFSDPTACLKAAESGLGIARSPAFVADRAISTGRVRQILREHVTPPNHGIYVLYPASHHLALKVRVLIDFLVEQFPEPPPWEAHLHH